MAIGMLLVSFLFRGQSTASCWGWCLWQSENGFASWSSAGLMTMLVVGSLPLSMTEVGLRLWLGGMQAAMWFGCFAMREAFGVFQCDWCGGRCLYEVVPFDHGKTRLHFCTYNCQWLWASEHGAPRLADFCDRSRPADR